MLRIQCFLQGADRQVTGDVPVCYACNDTPVIEVYDDTVVTHIPVFQEQVREIRAPFLVRPVCLKILFQPVLRHFMGLARFRPRLFWANDGMQPQSPVHILMDSSRAVAVSFTLQIGRHAAVAVNAVVSVVDLFDLLLDFCFLGVMICLPVFPVVVVGIRAQS